MIKQINVLLDRNPRLYYRYWPIQHLELSSYLMSLSTIVMYKDLSLPVCTRKIVEDEDLMNSKKIWLIDYWKLIIYREYEMFLSYSSFDCTMLNCTIMSLYLLYLYLRRYANLHCVDTSFCCTWRKLMYNWWRHNIAQKIQLRTTQTIINLQLLFIYIIYKSNRLTKL